MQFKYKVSKALPVAFLFGAVTMANAAVYTYVPNPADLNDLDHYHYYSWGIDTSNIGPNEKVVNATLTFKNIYDWVKEDNDRLFTTLLDTAPLGVKQFDDNQGGGDNFAGQGTHIGTWTDPKGGSSTGFDLVYDFKDLGLISKLQQYMSDKRIGLGFDPDCHYFNDGVKFTITTAPVPEPTSMAALGLGVMGLVRRRRARKAGK